MSKVARHCLKIAKRAGNLALCAKLALMIEAREHKSGAIELHAAYDSVRDVMNANQWAGHLSALAAEGFYRAETDPDYKGWGYLVKQADTDAE
ncbi:hypothetical protein BcepSauron_021 [Burkholderia phage BcepSauron]|uniref:Uncharacterized protein n=1 Tax=Burkholderia phage BcepSauron TaxID=2530033 RepID=A0A482MK41_9CAUD|nr:hypothetical protein H1O17_gp021 [Burkholderia phage BcepSauron]QBQ74401.1 hypothetical protein BcepSauron_021 [Burkholderia phage BcepSauron]